MQIRLGVNVIGCEPAGWLDICRRVEAVGLDEISVADHLVTGSKAPLVALAAAAAVTERITLSTMVLNNELRHPGELAAEAAMLAELSGGRFVLGMGAGYAQSEHDAVGLPLHPVARRMDRLAESVAALRALLRGDELTTEGPEYRFTAHRVWPIPTHPVPLLVGGGSPRLIEVAAQHADVVGFTGFSVVGAKPKLTHFSRPGLDDRVAMVRRASAHRDGEVRSQALVQVVRVTTDREGAAAAIAQEWGEDVLDIAAVLDCPFVLLGTATEIADQLRASAARWGIETWTMFSGRDGDASLEDLGDVAQALRP